MPKLLQIDTCLGVLSTGRITENIAKLANSQGWECHMIHGARYVGETVQNHYRVSSLAGEYMHYVESLIFDRHGLGSRLATNRIVEKIKEINPDVVHLHSLHGYYINYKVLFEFLGEIDASIFWTFHDCWAFTGHCTYFDKIDCIKWQTECYQCELIADYPKSLFVDRSKKNFKLKKYLFNNLENLSIITVSYWLEDIVNKSFFHGVKIETIHNGVDVRDFRPIGEPKLLQLKNLEGKNIILGVAAIWDERKGLDDFLQVNDLLDNSFQIVLVGLNEEQLKQIPSGVIGILKTNNTTELAELYSAAMVFVNPTYSDNFPTTNIEALACGTPVITYNTGGCAEAINQDTGIVVEKGSIVGLVDAIKEIKNKGKSHYTWLSRKRAIECFANDTQYSQYIKLYSETLK